MISISTASMRRSFASGRGVPLRRLVLVVFPAFHCRLRDICKACPNTAWILFLIFAVALVALVSVSVYLSKKRLNLSILGIGVVRLCVVRMKAK